MRRFAVPATITGIAALLLILLVVGISNTGSNNSIAYAVASKHYKLPPSDTSELPVLSSTLRRSLASYRGKMVLVNFFASWCEQCQLEATVLAQAQKVMAAAGGTVLGIAYSDNPSADVSYVHQYHVNYPVLSDPGGNLGNAWGLNGVPDSYLLNKQGKVVWLNLYQLPNSFYTTTLPKLIAQFS